eukprot:CAMPEP_0175173688 /NCGR_PEP_ID=MMETSP0087-20121206/32197_1 /TAXON_ID=136419 /ORGANISM="Unknown Unknown, Strain D1" /LENGTH=52 /DNA_ID=CAMNT_0016465037 /DNA_START=45 /DNA_END=203 /DNA_ORIENTATION=+
MMHLAAVNSPDSENNHFQLTKGSGGLYDSEDDDDVDGDDMVMEMMMNDLEDE